jgi:hypothetical protein
MSTNSQIAFAPLGETVVVPAAATVYIVQGKGI